MSDNISDVNAGTIACNVARDLMPLVVDSAASEESRALVESHVAGCAECARAMDEMRAGIKLAQVDEKDSDFVRFCLKMRKALSWRRVIRIALVCALALALIAGGVDYVRYKMYVDSIVVKPQEYSLSLDEHGFLIFDIVWTDAHNFVGYGYGYDDGTVYFTPHISAWPQLFKAPSKDMRYTMDSIRLKDGKLMYLEPDYSVDNLVFDEEQSAYVSIYKTNYFEIREVRIGTREDYDVAYRAGDTLPAYTG